MKTFRSVLALAAVICSAAVAVAAPKQIVRECPGGNCPAVVPYAPAVSYAVPAFAPTTETLKAMPERVSIGGVVYVRSDSAATSAAPAPKIRPEPKAPAVREECENCGCNKAAAPVRVEYIEAESAAGSCGISGRIGFGSCGSRSGRVGLGLCGGGSGGPVRNLIRSIFGGCGG